MKLPQDRVTQYRPRRVASRRKAMQCIVNQALGQLSSTNLHVYMYMFTLVTLSAQFQF